MGATIFLYNFFTSQMEMNNIKRWFLLVTINSCFLTKKRGFFCITRVMSGD
jgi:hypothetical protein